jgi:hypothetical protein
MKGDGATGRWEGWAASGVDRADESCLRGCRGAGAARVRAYASAPELYLGGSQGKIGHWLFYGAAATAAASFSAISERCERPRRWRAPESPTSERFGAEARSRVLMRGSSDRASRKNSTRG